MEDPGYESKDIYLKKEKDVLGLHSTGFPAETGWQQLEAWCNAYDEEFKFLGSIYRIFGPIEEEAASLKTDGWVEVERNLNKCAETECTKPIEAKRYQYCYNCWWAKDPRNKK